MKKSVKILSAILAVVLVFSCGVGATLAYLSAKTEKAVVNTFSAKNLLEKNDDFQIWEHKVERNKDTGAHEYTETKGESTLVKEISYERVTPGEVLPKDPFVRVKNVENAYLFVEVVNKLDPAMTFNMDSTWEALTKDGVNQVVGEHGGLVFVKKVSDASYTNEYLLPARAENVDYKILGDETIKVDGTFKPESATAEKPVTLSFYGYLTQCDATLGLPIKSWEAVYGPVVKTAEAFPGVTLAPIA